MEDSLSDGPAVKAVQTPTLRQAEIGLTPLIIPHTLPPSHTLARHLPCFFVFLISLLLFSLLRTVSDPLLESVSINQYDVGLCDE